MVDNLALMLAHGMLFFVLWRALKLRDPDDGAPRPVARVKPKRR